MTTFAVPWALCWPNRTIYPIRHMRPLRLESRYLSPFWFSFSFIQKDFRVPLDPTGGKQKVWNWTSRSLASAFAAKQFVRLSWKQKNFCRPLEELANGMLTCVEISWRSLLLNRFNEGRQVDPCNWFMQIRWRTLDSIGMHSKNFW